jgi:hypothetical protein
VNPALRPHPEGGWILDDLAPWFVTTLLGLPELLAPDPPERVRRRLYPDPTEDDDPDTREEWARLVHPELFALLASAREIVERDLRSLELGIEPGQASLTIPEDHVQAWISALNAGRLALSEEHGIDASVMDRSAPRATEDPETSVALTRIDLMGWIQEMLVHAVAPPPPDAFDEEDDALI